MLVRIVVRTENEADKDKGDEERLKGALERRGASVVCEGYFSGPRTPYPEPYDLVVLLGLSKLEDDAFAAAHWVRFLIGKSPLLIASHWEPQERNIAARLKKKYRAEYVSRADEAAVLAKACEMLKI
jgi:hypothetical protein